MFVQDFQSKYVGPYFSVELQSDLKPRSVICLRGRMCNWLKHKLFVLTSYTNAFTMRKTVDVNVVIFQEKKKTKRFKINAELKSSFTRSSSS